MIKLMMYWLWVLKFDLKILMFAAENRFYDVALHSNCQVKSCIIYIHLIEMNGYADCNVMNYSL